MPDIKISQLPAAASVENDDILPVVTDTSTTPVSKKATRATLLQGQATTAELEAHATRTDNPHGVIKAQVGLSQVPNTDATKRANHTGTQSASTISDFQETVSANTNVVANTNARHSHANKSLLDSYSQSEADLADAVGKKHSHTNKDILDATTSSFTTVKDDKLAGIETGAQKNVQSDWDASSGEAAIKNKPAIPSKTSDLTNDSGYLTAHQDISGKEDKANKDSNTSLGTSNDKYPTQRAVKTYVDAGLATKANASAIPTKTSELQNDSGFLTDHQDISGKADKATKVSAGTGLTGGGDLSTDRTIELSSGTQASLGKADTAVQPDQLGDLATKDNVTVADITATGTADATTYLRGDGKWDTVTAGDSLPDQTGNNGKFLTTDGTDPAWADLPGGGDMAKATYDPTNVGADAFAMDNMVEGTTNKILTAAERSSISSAIQPSDNVSDLTNDAGYLTSHQDVSGKEDKSNKKTTLADNSDTFYPTQKAVKTAIDAKADASSLADVATSGEYSDLKNKPTLGSAAAADTTDFATAAQGSLADTAIQTETDPTVPSWAKQPSKPSYTKSEVGLGNVTNDAQLKASQLDTSASLGSDDTKIPSQKAVKTYVDAKPTGDANVQSDWNEANSGSDAFIQNKPTLGSLAAKNKADIADINATGTTDSSTYLRGDGTWATPSGGGGGGASALDDLTDVDTTGKSDGDVLTYNSTSGDWEAKAPSGGGGGGGGGYDPLLLSSMDFRITNLDDNAITISNVDSKVSTTFHSGSLVSSIDSNANSNDRVLVEWYMHGFPTDKWQDVITGMTVYLNGYASTNSKSQWGFGSVSTLTGNHYGAIITGNSITGLIGDAWYASNGDNSTGTQTDITSYFNTNGSTGQFVFHIVRNKGVNIKFYRGNALMATHTASLRSANSGSVQLRYLHQTHSNYSSSSRIMGGKLWIDRS